MSTSNNLSNVTLNGQPVTDVLNKEASNEMHKALSDATPRVSRRAAGSKHKAFTNGISRNLELPEAEPDFTQWVLLNNIQYLRAAKGPFVDSGKSLFAALQYDPDTDKIKCHECGEWFVHYGRHRREFSNGHPSAKVYRQKHGLDAMTKLAGPKCRAEYRSRCVFTDEANKIHGFQKGHKRTGGRSVSSQEKLNAKFNCEAQIKHRIRLLAKELGKNPTLKEVAAIGITEWVIYYIFGSFKTALRQAGLIPTQRTFKDVSDKELLEHLAAFKKSTDKWPTHRQLREVGLYHSIYFRRFGSMEQAIAKAESRLQA